MVPQRSASVLSGIPIASLLALLLVASAATASFNIDLEAEAFEEPIGVGESRDIQVNVTIESRQPMLCLFEGGPVVLDLEVSGESPEYGFHADIHPLTLEYMIPAGTYGTPLVDDYEGENVATFTAYITDNVQEGHTMHTFVLEASYSGGPPANCLSNDWHDSSEQVTILVETELPQNEESAAGQDEEQEQADEQHPLAHAIEELPGPTVGFVILVTALVLATRKRT